MNKIKRFYKPNIITISLAFLCLGLTLKFILPLLSMVNFVPCKVITPGSSYNEFCPVNPDPDVSTYYFMFAATDVMYQIIYLIFVVVIIPYTMSCAIFKLYYKYIKGIVNR